MQRHVTRVMLLAAGFATAVTLVASGARAETPAGPDTVAAVVANPDLNGYWKLNRTRSLLPPSPEHLEKMRDAYRRRTGGSGAGRPPSGPRDLPRVKRSDRPGSVGRLPELIHVTHTKSMVSIEDSIGTVVQEVATTPAADSSAAAPGAMRLSGAWSAGRLAVSRPGWNGVTVTETIALEDTETMIVDVKVQSDGTVPSREFRRVYQKVTEW